MRRIIFFIPWDRPDANEQYGKCIEWQKYIERKKDHTHKVFITYANGFEWEMIRRSTYADAAIYVRGHGSPGGSRVSNANPPTVSASYEEVCDSLITAGLKPEFMGEIKFWNCSSGKDEGPNLSFAKKCADYMRNKGYSKCKYYGYTESITSYYIGSHKYAVKKNSLFFGLFKWRSAAGRASDYRREV